MEFFGLELPAAKADGVVAGEGALAGEEVEAVELEEGVEDGLADEALEGGAGHAGGVDEAHVLGGEGDDRIDSLVGIAEAGEDVAGERGADAVVAGEADAVLKGLRGGLADVVEEGGEGEFERWGFEALEEAEGVDPDIAFGVELGRLADALHPGDLGEDFGEQAGFVEEFEAAAGMAFGEEAGEFVADALGGDAGDGGGEGADGREGIGVDVEGEAGGEADGAEEAEVVFREAGGWIADGANGAVAEIVEAAGVVGDFTGEGVLEQGVDGEVAAEDVEAGIGFEAHGIRVAAVEVGVFGAEGGDLDLAGVAAEEDDAEVSAGLEGVGEEGGEEGRGGGGGEVVVVEGEAEEVVADAAADEKDLVAGGAESAGDLEDEGVWRVGCHVLIVE